MTLMKALAAAAVQPGAFTGGQSPLLPASQGPGQLKYGPKVSWALSGAPFVLQILRGRLGTVHQRQGDVWNLHPTSHIRA